MISSWQSESKIAKKFTIMLRDRGVRAENGASRRLGLDTFVAAVLSSWHSGYETASIASCERTVWPHQRSRTRA